MPTLYNAPLIEVVFEIKWGKATKTSHSVQWEFTEADSRIYFGEFGIGAGNVGYTHREVLPRRDGVRPFEALDRYRKKPETWPCLQAGIGVVTVNQINSGYEWGQFRKEVELALKVLDGCSSLGGLSNLQPLGVELRYQDGFVLEEPDAPISFLRDNLNFGIRVPEDFHSHESIEGTASNSHLGFQYETIEPSGEIVIDTQQVLINGKSGYVLNLSLQSNGDKAPSFSVDSLMVWLEAAHKIQQHTFKSLVTDKLAQTFNGS